jgi:hypothetical protein
MNLFGCCINKKKNNNSKLDNKNTSYISKLEYNFDINELNLNDVYCHIYGTDELLLCGGSIKISYSLYSNADYVLNILDKETLHNKFVCLPMYFYESNEKYDNISDKYNDTIDNYYKPLLEKFNNNDNIYDSFIVDFQLGITGSPKDSENNDIKNQKCLSWCVTDDPTIFINRKRENSNDQSGLVIIIMKIYDLIKLVKHFFSYEICYPNNKLIDYNYNYYIDNTIREIVEEIGYIDKYEYNLLYSIEPYCFEKKKYIRFVWSYVFELKCNNLISSISSDNIRKIFFNIL